MEDGARMSGFYLMHRGWHDSPIFGREAYSRRDAWVWMIEQAVYTEHDIDIAGKTITLHRGQFSSSLRYMAKAWGWDEAKVRRFISRARNEKMIDASSDAGQTIITICNYDKYQSLEKSTDAPNDAAATQQRRGSDANNNKGNQGNEISSEANASSDTPAPQKSASAFPCPQGVDPIDWDGLVQNRKRQKAPMTEAAYRGIVNKLERWNRDGWPPGPIVANAAERGWRTVFETDEMKNGNRGPQTFSGSAGYSGRAQQPRPAAGFERRAFEARSREGTEEAERHANRETGGNVELPYFPT